MRRFLVAAAIGGLLSLGAAAPAFATPTGPVSHPGQHNQDCGALGTPPGGGNSANSPGSPFASGSSANNYAGQQPQNSNNGQNSQYDVACAQQSAH